MRTIVQEVGESVGDVKELQNDFYSMVLKINAMNNTMEKLLDEQTRHANENRNDYFQDKINKIFTVDKLKFSDYEQTDKEPRKDGVTKWVKVGNKAEEFAFKSISDKEDQKLVQNQVTILKELHNFENIIKFYGLTSNGNKHFLVTEWAEYGNLREFYTNHKDIFDIRLKLRIALDIARGLNFLRTVEVKYQILFNRSFNLL